MYAGVEKGKRLDEEQEEKFKVAWKIKRDQAYIDIYVSSSSLMWRIKRITEGSQYLVIPKYSSQARIVG